MVIVGYNDIGEYWIAKNSWGADWNGDGYFKIGYDECLIGESWDFADDSGYYCAIDVDGDEIGDFCDDNCPFVYNPDQIDDDNDGVGNICDNCPAAYNPDQTDYDLDSFGDECDTCTDTDGDGFGDPDFPQNTCVQDNCPLLYNPSQMDNTGNGIGDECEFCGDPDADGHTDILDILYLVKYLYFNGPAPTPYECIADANNDGTINVLDIICLINFAYADGPPPPLVSECCNPIW